jgi:hypothetical protein
MAAAIFCGCAGCCLPRLGEPGCNEDAQTHDQPFPQAHDCLPQQEVTTLESPSPEGIWKALPDRCNPTGARSRHVAILAAFAVDVEQLAVAVYVAHLELRTLQQAD